MKKIIKSTLMLGLMVLSFGSCVQDLDVAPIDPSVNMEFDQDGVFVKCYATLGLTGQQGVAGFGDVDGIDEGTSAFYRMMWELNEFPTDEGWWIWGDTGVPQIREMSWNNTNDLVRGLYYRLYFDVTLCNHFLEKTEGNTDDKSVKQRAEVRLIRALNYYYLLDMYGSVPHPLKVSTDKPMQITRPKLYKWIEEELLAIENDMFDDGAKTGYYRTDKTAAWLLLSRLYLNAEVYTGTPQWDKTAEYSAKVMSSSYTLAPEFRHLFMGDNDTRSAMNKAYQEIILPISQDGMHTTSYGGARFLIAGMADSGLNDCGLGDTWSCFRSSPTLVEKFFDLSTAASVKGDDLTIPTLAGDDRALLASYVEKEDTAGVLQPTFETTLKAGMAADFKASWAICKFSNVYVDSSMKPSAVNDPDMDIPFLRAAEAYLTYAEAVVRGGAEVGGKTALQAVNDLRARANAVAWTSGDLTLDNLLDEWSREFFCEGRRRIDLVRFGQFAGDQATYNWEGKGGSATGKSVDSKYNVFPIPHTDLIANPNLTPTPGY